jgi:hypothetical protein
MDPLLQYDLISDPFPLLASTEGKPANKASLTIVATNSTTGSVRLQGILVKIPVGGGASQLSNGATDINAIAPTNWDPKDVQHPENFVIYNFQPQNGNGELAANASLNFVFTSIPVNNVTGTVLIEITEGSGNCVPPNCPVQDLAVTKFPDNWGSVNFAATKNIINAGEGIQLKWDGPASATYSIEYYTPQTNIVHVPRPGEQPLANEGIYPDQPLSLQRTTIFSLNVDENVNGNPHHATAQMTVTVVNPQPKINSFTIKPTVADLSQEKIELTFTWDVSNPRTLELEGVGTVTGITLTKKVQVNNKYTLKAYGSDGYVDELSATLHSFHHFMVSNSFVLVYHGTEKITGPGGAPTDCPYIMTMTNSFARDGTGKCTCVWNGVDCALGGTVDHWFTWTISGATITASAQQGDTVLTMILEISNETLLYKKGFDDLHVDANTPFRSTPLHDQ